MPETRHSLRVCFLIGEMSGGGAERVMALLANWLASRGMPVTLMTFASLEHASAYELDPRVKRVGVGIYKPDSGIVHPVREIFRPGNLARFVRLRRAMVSSGADAFISFLDRNNVATLISALGLPRPVIVSERLHIADLGPFWGILRRLFYPLARAVVSQTESNAAQLRQLGFSNVTVIPNPVVKPEGKRLAGIAGGRPFVLAAGRLVDQKDYSTLLRAFADVSLDHPDWGLVIVGKGPLQGELESLARNLGIAGKVYFEGWRKNVGDYFASATAFAMSSKTEGFPNALCEAMSWGLPVVCTDCPSGPSEIVVSGSSGLLVPVGDVEAFANALGRVMGDPSLRAALGEAAQKSMERYDIARVAEQWLTLLEGRAKKGGSH